MINKKISILFIVFFLLNGCSFDSKTGIWGDKEKEEKRVSELEKKQKQILGIQKVYSSEITYNIKKSLSRKINLSKPKINSKWLSSNLNNKNFLGNIYLTGSNNKFLKKKIGKNKFPIRKAMSPLLAFSNNLIVSDDMGTIFSFDTEGKINWKKNIYKKIYKRIYKNLIFSIYSKNLYVADNIGFIYSISLDTGKIIWIKNYGIPIKSNIQVFENQMFLIDQDNKIICLDINDGSLIWDVLSISSFIKTQNLLSLAISNNEDLFAMTSSADLFKINIKSGRIIWSRNVAESLYSNATDFFASSQLVIDNKKILFSAGNSFFSYDILNGNVDWVVNLDCVGTPIVDGENIFIVTKNGYFVILDKKTGSIISSNNILDSLKIKKQNTKVINFIMGSGKIYVATLNGYLIIISATTGKVISHDSIGHPIISPLIINNGALYLFTEQSKIIGFK